MGRWSIRRLMLVIAGVAGVLWGYVALERMYPAHECGPRNRCASNLRNAVLGALIYANDHGYFPEGTWPNAGLPPEKRLSWYAATSPYLDWPEYWEALEKGQSWDSPANSAISDAPHPLLRCPEAALPPVGGPFLASYIGIAGLGIDAPGLPKGHPRAGVFGHDRRTRLADLTDGAAFTMVVAETGRMRGSWLAGDYATIRGLDTADQPYIGAGRQFGGLHRGSGMNVAFADGAVRFITDTIDPKILEAFSTIAGGEKLPANVFDQ